MVHARCVMLSIDDAYVNGVYWGDVFFFMNIHGAPRTKAGFNQEVCRERWPRTSKTGEGCLLEAPMVWSNLQPL